MFIVLINHMLSSHFRNLSHFQTGLLFLYSGINLGIVFNYRANSMCFNIIYKKYTTRKSNPLFSYQLHPWWATSVLCDRNHAIVHWTQPVKYRVICKYFPFCFNFELPIKHLPYGPNVIPNYISVENFVILFDARRGVIARAILSIILNNVIK